MAKANERREDGTLTAVDLFAGCGGLTLGLIESGFSVVGAVECNRTAIDAYKLNHERTKLWEADICDLSPRDVKREAGLRKGQLDLLAGCPPCQGFSSMRTLNGSRPVADERNELVFQFLRFAEALRPKTILMENVPALASDWRIRSVSAALERAGYLCKVGILDAADFGVPQRRRRMLLMASRLGPFDFPPKDSNRRTVLEAIGSLPPPGSSGDELHDLPFRRAPRVLDLIRAIPKDGGSRSDLGPESQLACHQKCDGFKDVYGRMSWGEVSPTITSGCINPSKGRFLHPEQDRAITLREAAILQGFPPDYAFPIHKGRYPIAELIGNAIPAAFVMQQVSVLKEQLTAKMRRRIGPRPTNPA